MTLITTLVFYGFASLLILSALAVVTFRNVFHSAIALIGALSVVAGFFVLLGADFLAASQILIYVGGIMIIMLFVVMLSQQPLAALQRQTNDQRLLSLFLAVVVAASLIQTFRTFFAHTTSHLEGFATSVALGRLLLGDMVLPFEAASLVLLAALVGAVLFGRDTSS